MFKKKKTGCKTPKFKKPTVPPQYSVPPMPQVAQPKIKEFENYKDLIIVPKHGKINEWKDPYYIPYKDEILVGYNDIQTIYKLGDGLHKWDELPEVSIEEALALGYVFHEQWKYRIKLEVIPTRTMRSKENNKCKD